jgi:hypothetical protein
MFLFNKKAPKKISFNGFKVGKVICNDICVWIAKVLTLITGKPPIKLASSTGDDIVDYKVYGESIQEATPSPTAPVEVESVGEKTKNLFDINSATSISPINVNSTIQKVNGNFVIKRYNTTNAMGLYFDYHFKAGKYALKIDYLNTNYSPKSSYIMYFADKSICVDTSSVGYRNTVKKLNIPEDMTVQIVIYTNDNNVVGNECTFSIMLSEGYNDIPYEPFGYKIPITVSGNGEPITTNIYLDEPLRKIGNAADYIDFENSKVVRKIKKKQLTKADVLYTISGITGFYSYNFLDSGYSRIKGLSNREKTFTESWKDGTTLWLGVNTPVVYWIGILTKLGFTTLAEMNAWLKENETWIYWATKTPTETTITLPTLQTNEGTNIIEVNTAVTPSNMEINYYKQGG